MVKKLLPENRRLRQELHRYETALDDLKAGRVRTSPVFG